MPIIINVQVKSGETNKMGLSSSQGRLLLLTSRISDVELSEMLLSQKQQLLAIDRENVTKEYMDAMNNYKVTIKIQDDSGNYKQENINYSNMAKSGYFLTNAKNQVYLKKNAETGEWDTSGIDSEILSINSEGKAVISGFDKTFDIIDGTEFLDNEETIKHSIINGAVYVLKAGNNDDKSGITNVDLNSDTSIEYVLDTSDDAKAESKYEYELAKISKQEKAIETEIQQLETQHNALMKELESVRNVINKNEERTFNLFSNG